MKETYLLKPLQTLLVLGLMFTLTNCGNLDNPLEELSGSGGSGGSSTVSVTSITLDPTTLTKKVGDEAVTLTATVKPDDATDKTVTWTSDKESVATVDETGKVTFVGAGTATITATAKDGSGIEGKCTVTVSKPALLTGQFCINAYGKKVQFSRGNLQATYDGSSWTWAFAENQWDYIGNAAANNAISGNGTVSADGTVDLFGWSTAATTYGIHNSNNNNDYSGDFKEWGQTMGTDWRTLKSDEWGYLFNTRAGSTVNITPTKSNARWAYATINTDETGVNGIIMFPDGLTIEESEATSWGNINEGPASSSWNNSTKCTTAQWNALEAKGCVFLPAAGYRPTAVTKPGIYGYYWSSSKHTTNVARAFFVRIYETSLSPEINDSRYYGCSVRLVKDVE